MPLLPNVLADALDSFGNPNAPGFIAGPVDEADGRRLHAAAARTYFEGLVPQPVPGTFALAEAAMEAALVGQTLPPPAAVQAINAAYVAFAGAVIAGLAGTGWVVTTPPNPAGPIVSPLPPGAGSLAFAAQVQTWAIAVTGGVPPAAGVPWA